MSIYSSIFGGGGGAVLGGIVQGVGLAEPGYIACDGRSVSRSTYPSLSSLFPFGKLTGTIRTLAVTPTNYALAATPTYFVASSANVAGTTAIQYSTDGVTWSQASVVTPSIITLNLIWAGTRLVGTGQNAGTQTFATTGDNPGSTWVACTGLVSAVVPRFGLSYGAGKVLALVSGSTTAAATLDDGSTTWVARTLPSAQDKQAACWTGTRFIVVAGGTATIAKSNDAITWADDTLPEATVASQGGIASNGSGTVVVSGLTSGLLASYDHGATWNRVAIPNVQPDTSWKVQFIGDRFVVPTTLGLAMSTDGLNWFLEPQVVQARVAACTVARKGATIMQLQGSATAYSFAESTITFNAPLLQTFAVNAAGASVPMAPSFIRAQ